MNPPLLIVCLLLVALQFTLPRWWAFLPLLLAACHTPYDSRLVGLSVARIVILAGLVRAASSGSLQLNFRDPFDRWMTFLVGVALLSSVGHATVLSEPFGFRCGLVLNIWGSYLYARAYLTTGAVMEQLGIGLVIVLVPFALMMVIEKLTGNCPYTLIGAQNAYSLVRDGKIRAQGVFGTPILAGTAGACAIPLLISMWRIRRKLAILGLASCLIITYCSASSGPIGTILLGVGAFLLWPCRTSMRQIRIAAILILVLLQLIKERPIWYLMALMDFVGGSTGWHRAYLMDMGFKHLSEWWLWGTDYTAHWMPYSLPTTVPGIRQSDMTNYYLHLGVIGGIPLMFCLLAVQWNSFKHLGRRMLEMRTLGDDREFSLWCVGVAFFAHSVTFLSISYFDQMYVFFWMVVGGLPALLAAPQDASHPAHDANDEPAFQGLDVHPECSGYPESRHNLNSKTNES